MLMSRLPQKSTGLADFAQDLVDSYPPLIPLKEAAKALNCCDRTIRRMISCGLLVRPPGPRTLVTRASLIAYLGGAL